MTDEYLLELALDWVNRIRDKLGVEPLEELPAGRAGCPTRCVLAKATGATFTSLHTSWFYPWGSRGRAAPFECIRHPLHVTEFLRRFDRGRYPHLIQSELLAVA